MRKKIVAGNWKMNLLRSEAKKLVQDLSSFNDSSVEMILFPPALFLQEVREYKNESIHIGAQNFYPKDKGAYTGEISIPQLKDMGVSYVLVGHSERRAYFFENEEFLKNKINASLEYNLTPVFCCGEPLEIRESKKELTYVKKQLIDSLFHLTEDQIKKCVIAYEPVWAIGTGMTATVEQAEEMHKAIRFWIEERYNKTVTDSISILYGGSCNAKNAEELFACPNVDGGLIGGASLESEAFLTIANSF
jgi:triosephosphate isomerase (TIM)